MKISASIYSTSRDLEQVVRELDNHRIDFFHVDCNDDPKVFDDIINIRKWSKTPIDLHIISKTPEKTNRWVIDAHMKDSIKTIAKFDNMIAP